MDNLNNLDMGLINPDPITIETFDITGNSEKRWLSLTIEDWTFVAIMGLVILIILFASRPMIGPALDNMGSAAADNSVTNFVMSQFSETYVLSKKDDELKEALEKLKKPQIKNEKLSKLKEYIEHDIQRVISEEIDNKLVEKAAIDAVAGGKKFRSIIAYSIVNRMRRTIASQGGQPRQYEASNIVAVELMHNSCLILADMLDKSEYRRDGMSIHNSYDHNIALLTAMQLNLIGLKLVGEVDHISKQYAAENQIRQRIELEKKNSSENAGVQIDPFEMAYNLTLSACNDVSRLVDGQVLDVYGKKGKITASKSRILDFMKKKSCSDFNLMFEMSWILGGGPIRAEYIDYLRNMGTDFGILYQIYDDFSDYYSDRVDSSLNFVVTVGPDAAHNEFYVRMESFVQKAGELGIMTGALKHIVSYLSDTVTLAKQIIDTDEGGEKKERDDDEITEDTDTETDD
jgi:geranylgeranyl pyrophosphate synthase